MVKIMILGPDEKSHELAEEGHGSGVVVGPHTIVTARHVGETRDGEVLRVIDQDGKTYTVAKVWLDPKNDFAVLTIKETIKIKAAAVSCTPVKALDRLYIVGYPLEFDSMIFEVIAVDYVNDGGAVVLAATGVALAGDSGGPVFNKAGQLVGILVGEFLDGNGIQATNDTDVNVVVPVTETICKAAV